MLFKVDFVTYEGVYKTIETEKLNIPTSEGRRTILSNHMPLIIPMQIGVIETCKDGVLSHYAVNNGVLYFKDNEAEVIADSVIDVEEIDVDLAYKEIEKAQKHIEEAKREYEKILYRNKLEVANNLINAAKKYLS
ncbi:MAG: ATP synthase F1 subunit epsilon [Erysipelotrichaceae bacterium]|nr:ATP synthase F1 subunit epsilon [Erysipelotrichaceae bacterium]